MHNVGEILLHLYRPIIGGEAFMNIDENDINPDGFFQDTAYKGAFDAGIGSFWLCNSYLAAISCDLPDRSSDTSCRLTVNMFHNHDFLSECSAQVPALFNEKIPAYKANFAMIIM